VNKRHTNTESIAEVTASAGLTSLASPCRAKGASQTFGRYGKNGVCFCHHPVLVGTFTWSAAVNRRSRWGPERCRPVISSHFSFGAAPQVGQRTANICFGLSPALIARQCPKPNGQEWSILNSYENSSARKIRSHFLVALYATAPCPAMDGKMRLVMVYTDSREIGLCAEQQRAMDGTLCPSSRGTRPRKAVGPHLRDYPPSGRKRAAVETQHPEHSASLVNLPILPSPVRPFRQRNYKTLLT
jgi:hypothetical protein